MGADRQHAESKRAGRQGAEFQHPEYKCPECTSMPTRQIVDVIKCRPV
jgi:hypothetical protein